MVAQDKLLNAINACLRAGGYRPVSSSTSTHPQVAVAKDVIAEASTDVQMEGWWCNTDYKLSMTRDQNGHIFLPNETLFVGANDPRIQVVERGDRLYDAVRNSYVFDSSIVVNIVRELALDEMPNALFELVKSTAVLEYYEDLEEGTQSDTQKYERRAARALLLCKKVHERNSRANIYTTPKQLRLFSNSKINPITTASNLALASAGIGSANSDG